MLQMQIIMALPTEGGGENRLQQSQRHQARLGTSPDHKRRSGQLLTTLGLDQDNRREDTAAVQGDKGPVCYPQKEHL